MNSPAHAIDSSLDLVFDVGMHRGEDTAFYLAMGFRVVGFEANPELAAACRERFAEQIADGRVTIVEGAITEPGETSVTFYRSDRLSAWGTTDGEWVSRRENLAGFEEVTVPAVDFGHCLRRYGMPYYLKIDIEGADRHCLTALRAFSHRPRYLSIESEKFSYEALVEEFDLFSELGYGRYAVVQQANIPGQLLRTTNISGAPIDYRFERDASGAFGGDVGPWIDRDEALRRYRSIFRSYRLFGETSPLRKVRLGRILLARIPRYTGRSLPGWYDTHAMLVE
ncbi:MAG: FkbM family methyltransferase [Solirubrobacterales bacterium]